MAFHPERIDNKAPETTPALQALIHEAWPAGHELASTSKGSMTRSNNDGFTLASADMGACVDGLEDLAKAFGKLGGGEAIANYPNFDLRITQHGCEQLFPGIMDP